MLFVTKQSSSRVPLPNFVFSCQPPQLPAPPPPSGAILGPYALPYWNNQFCNSETHIGTNNSGNQREAMSSRQPTTCDPSRLILTPFSSPWGPEDIQRGPRTCPGHVSMPRLPLHLTFVERRPEFHPSPPYGQANGKDIRSPSHPALLWTFSVHWEEQPALSASQSCLNRGQLSGARFTRLGNAAARRVYGS